MASNETLSQEEIDNLLNSFGGETEEGEQSEELEPPKLEEKSVREYNFRRPVKFSREQQRTLQLIHENFAREISTYLSGRTRTFVEVRYASIDQITFSEFQQSLTTPTYMGIFSTDLLSGSAILQIGLDIGYVIIDKLLGGPGISIEDMRSPTDIEMSILRKESSVMLRSLSKAWANISEFDVQMDKVETNPQFVQIAPPNEMTVLITMSITVRDVQGFINICFPSSTLEPVSDKLNTRMWTQSYKYSEKSKEDLKKLIMLSEMSLSAVLGQSTLTLNDLMRIQTGDVLRLNSFYEDPINVEIQGIPVYKSKIGKHKGYYAVKIEEENKELLEKIMLEQSLHTTKDDKKEEVDKENGGEKNVE
jgi:flagellar motor switch protein FliM